ncbi:MAG TPA: MATE family efflux transporter, partial [Novosphingobium sp.]|nr:MATE family efflux transporter [Novosphingobium sp.]
IAFTTMAETGLFGGAAFLMGRIGSTELAAHALALQIAAFAFMLPLGIGQAATIRVGYHFGAGDHAAMGRAGWMALATGLGFALASAGLMWGAPHLLLSAYIDVTDPAHAAMTHVAVRFLAVAAAFQLADSTQAVLAGALRGLQDTRRPMAFALIGYWAVGFVLAAGLGLGTQAGGMGVWTGLAAGLAVVAVLLLRRWHSREALGLTRLPAPDGAI